MQASQLTDNMLVLCDSGSQYVTFTLKLQCNGQQISGQIKCEPNNMLTQPEKEKTLQLA